jgi:hypothetical protein
VKISLNEPMKMYYNNQATMHIVSNPVFHERTKHIEIDYHFVREKIQSEQTETSFMSSQESI